MRRIEIFVSKKDEKSPFEAESVKFDDGEEKALGENGDLKKSSEKPALRFILLALHTYMVRSVRKKLRVPIGIVATPEKYRNILVSLWDSKSRSGTEWKSDLFDSDPFDSRKPFLETQGSRQTFSIWIPPEVEIEVTLRPQSVRTPSDTIDQVISGIADRFLKSTPLESSRKIRIELVDGPENINSDRRGGHIYTGFPFRLLIEWESMEDPMILWIDSENSLKPLFPIPFDPRIKAKVSQSPSKGTRSLLLPVETRMKITTPPGTETCLVLFPSPGEALSAKVITDVIASILPSRSSDPDDPELQKADCHFFRSPENQNVRRLRRRLELEMPLTEWESLLAEKLAGKVADLAIFQIPNR